MDDRCIGCPYICKSLDDADEPVQYAFKSLSPNDVITLVDNLVRRRKGKRLEIKAYCRKPKSVFFLLEPMRRLYSLEAGCNYIYIQAESRKVSGQTRFWFWFDIPKQWCQRIGVVGDVTKLVHEVLSYLQYCDKLMQSGNLARGSRNRLPLAIAAIAYDGINCL